jgi:cytochrome P450
MRLGERVGAEVLGAVARAFFAWEKLTTGAAYAPTRRRNLDDPYPMYRDLRERDPIHRSRVVGGWVLSRYRDITPVLRDARFSADDRSAASFEREHRRRVRAGIVSEEEEYNPSMLRLDPPDHTRLRGLVSKAFTPRAVERLRPRVESIVQGLLDAAESNGALDVVEDLGYPLPVTVIAEMLGVPSEERAQFKHWSDEVVRGLGFGSLDDERRSEAASRQLSAYLEGIVARRRSDPREDLITALVQAEEGGDRLSAAEILSTCILLLVAGNETTTNLIGNGMLALLRHPAQLEPLRANPSRITSAVTELLRYDSPVQATSRIATADVELRDGSIVRAGEQVILLLGSANRDPEVFPEPDRLDITRDGERHLSFGLGTHFCLGAPLAQLEAQVAIAALIERFPGLKLASERIAWGDNAILRGVTSLPVRF